MATLTGSGLRQDQDGGPGPEGGVVHSRRRESLVRVVVVDPVHHETPRVTRGGVEERLRRPTRAQQLVAHHLSRAGIHDHDQRDGAEVGGVNVGEVGVPPLVRLEGAEVPALRQSGSREGPPATRPPP